MKKKVWIFGDSYGDLTYTQRDPLTWPGELNKKYDVSNFSMTGTGPDWSLSLLNENMKSQGLDNLKDVTLIFLISSAFRFNFSFYETPKHQRLFSIFDNVYNLKDTLRYKKELVKYSSYRKFCREFLKYYADEQNYCSTKLMKITGTLKLYEPFFEKIMVWPIFDDTDTPISQTDKFYYVDKKLSLLEYNNKFQGKDSRSNHLSKENHVVMLEQLLNWIEYNTPIDLSKFIYNVDQK
jgi:hypothetical protein